MDIPNIINFGITKFVGVIILKSCFFIVHRDTSEALYPLIASEVERHIIEYGVAEFISGQYGKFDSMAARAVKGMRKRGEK